MGYPKKPTDLFVVNGWYLELPGLVSPHFETLEGLSKKTGKVEIVDAGTNIKYKFSSQIKDFGAITLTRAKDGTNDDIIMNGLVNASIELGVKYAGQLIKLHHGSEVFRIAFVGMLFDSNAHPSHNINGEEKYVQTFGASIDEWEEIPTGR